MKIICSTYVECVHVLYISGLCLGTRSGRSTSRGPVSSSPGQHSARRRSERLITSKDNLVWMTCQLSYSKCNFPLNPYDRLSVGFGWFWVEANWFGQATILKFVGFGFRMIFCILWNPNLQKIHFISIHRTVAAWKKNKCSDRPMEM